MSSSTLNDVGRTSPAKDVHYKLSDVPFEAYLNKDHVDGWYIKTTELRMIFLKWHEKIALQLGFTTVPELDKKFIATRRRC